MFVCLFVCVCMVTASEEQQQQQHTHTRPKTISKIYTFAFVCHFYSFSFVRFGFFICNFDSIFLAPPKKRVNSSAHLIMTINIIIYNTLWWDKDLFGIMWMQKKTPNDRMNLSHCFVRWFFVIDIHFYRPIERVSNFKQILLTKIHLNEGFDTFFGMICFNWNAFSCVRVYFYLTAVENAGFFRSLF